MASIIGQAMYYLPHHNSIQYILSTMFYVDREHNVPTTFASLLLLFAAILLFTIALNQVKKKLAASHWFVLACGFAFMSIDEMFSLHERLIQPTHNLLTGLLNVEHLGLFRFAWVIPGIVLVMLLIPYFWNFVMELPRHTRRNFIMSAAIFLAGAIGTELIGGYFFELYGVDNFAYSMIATVEESLEMTGVILFIHGLMSFIAESKSEAIAENSLPEAF
ncbi:hypothetical protein [[Leptolyngbya] sp. PCC 7376]|uniref:hypothetical protein n=1 Tax=[Leptolyngbya] sp. PCC 7376 TaxID=111781 RepID=UPI00135718B9|nr:hypothetical protein [[Leptolyngbya] sp. PCC 7376]